ncbi:macro domain-containing protein, partial [bacterium]|nr:macro domain-containing protein [bacterium]
MIVHATGNLLQSGAEALVNTVNCIGYMGKGIALQFKKAFPENFKAYQRACKVGKVKPGNMFIFETGTMTNPKYIINFPTKRHWREKSRVQYIEAGLDALIKDVQRLGIRSIAVPPLGAGYGGLDWPIIRPTIEEKFTDASAVRVLLYGPSGPPAAETMPIGTDRPKMTSARALLIKMIDQYASLAYRTTLLEIHKLAYFLQEAGENLRLKYEAAYYGPYAANLNKVLEIMEGHFLQGYGDNQKPDVDIHLMPSAVETAGTFLASRQGSIGRLNKVNNLIEGFETPYGMELLSSVHWV